jgi:hypothetical protein
LAPEAITTLPETSTPLTRRCGKVDRLVGGEVDAGGAGPVAAALLLELAQDVVARRDAAELANRLIVVAGRHPCDAARLHLLLAEHVLRQHGHDDAPARGLLRSAKRDLNVNGRYRVHRQVEFDAIAGVERDG